MAALATLENATVETRERKIRNVSVTIHDGWVVVEDGDEVWIPRERVLNVVR